MFESTVSLAFSLSLETQKTILRYPKQMSNREESWQIDFL